MEVIALAGILIISCVLLNHYLHNFWTRRGFFQLRPKPLLGDIGDVLLLKKSIAEVYRELYEKSKLKKFCGVYFMYRPGLLINDPVLVQNILVKDFQHFTDHGLYVDEKYDPLSGHLFSLRGEKWKNLRSKLTPLFSPGKLKMMFPTFLDCALNLQNHVKIRVGSSYDVIEIRDLLARYTTDVIASVAFGIDNDSVNQPDNLFRKVGSKVFNPSLKAGLRAFMTFLVPDLNRIVGLKVADKDVEEFMFDMVKTTIEHREEKNEQRKDFMQMMITLKNLGENKGEAGKSQDGLSFNEVVAQAFVFFIGAFESTSSTIALCLYELTKNTELQGRVQDEIDEVLRRNEALEINYDLVTQMKYLDCCIDETVRKYPPAPFLIRECTKNYKIPGTDLTIERGTPLIISSFGLHRDKNIFDNPLSYRPERFLNSTTGRGEGKGLFYIPFGDGPRVCIGQRLGKLTTKLGLVALLSKFNFEFENKVPAKELTFSPKQFILTLSDNINLKVSLRNSY